MTNQTRDKLLISMAILLHEIVENNSSLFDCDHDDVEALWMAITKATAEHHIEVREQDETIQELEATIAKLKERCRQDDEQIESVENIWIGLMVKRAGMVQILLCAI